MKHKLGILFICITLLFTVAFVVDTFYHPTYGTLFNPPPPQVYVDSDITFYRYPQSQFKTTLHVKISQEKPYTVTFEFEYLSNQFEPTNVSIFRRIFSDYTKIIELDIPAIGLVYILEYPNDALEAFYRLDIDFAEGYLNIGVPGQYEAQVITPFDIFVLLFRLLFIPILGIGIFVASLKRISLKHMIRNIASLFDLSIEDGRIEKIDQQMDETEKIIDVSDLNLFLKRLSNSFPLILLILVFPLFFGVGIAIFRLIMSFYFLAFTWYLGMAFDLIEADWTDQVSITMLFLLVGSAGCIFPFPLLSKMINNGFVLTFRIGLRNFSVVILLTLFISMFAIKYRDLRSKMKLNFNHLLPIIPIFVLEYILITGIKTVGRVIFFPF